ncbi:histone H1B-like isoform 2-T2 [Pelodytes ibericus]
MAETAPKAPSKKAASVKKPAKSSGPSVSEQILKSVAASKERSGVSLAALKNVLAAGGYDVEKNNSRIKVAVRSLVAKGDLVQVKGTGASGSFKLNKKQVEDKEKAAKKKAPAKAKKPAPKKVAKSPKKPKKAPAASKSPKKAKKPAAKPKKVAKSPKKVKAAQPKKAVKSPAKKVAKPKAKSPAKAAAKPKRAAPKKR